MADEELLNGGDEWTANSNRALTCSICAPGKISPPLYEFHPEFTYPIFGDKEAIYGYKDLSINLSYAAHNLLCYADMSFSVKKKQPSAGKGAIINPLTTLKPFLSDDTQYKEKQKWSKHVEESARSFIPPGKFLSSYSSKGSTFEVYRSTLQDEATLKLHHRIKLFSLLFIEGGSFIDENDPQWEIFLLYEKTKEKKFIFIGYSTVYAYLYFQSAKIHDRDPNTIDTLLRRKRISQFVILPPFQHHAHGIRFYNILFDYFMADPLVKEVTAEDPRETFDDMRDRADIIRLIRAKVFENETFRKAPPLNSKWISKARIENKMTQRQFERCCEMIELSHLDKKDKPKYKQYRLQVKRRLYHHNREALKLLKKQEVKERLEATYHVVEHDYLRLLKVLPKLKALYESSAPPASPKKRSGSTTPSDHQHSRKKIKK